MLNHCKSLDNNEEECIAWNGDPNLAPELQSVGAVILSYMKYMEISLGKKHSVVGTVRQSELPPVVGSETILASCTRT